MENSAYQQDKQKLIENMIMKSKESFLLAIELYNKPTISLRTEGFLYFSCTAWELLLKAKLMIDGKSIYYKKSGSSANKSISLSSAIKLVMSNESDLVRKNLEIISGVRNFATHLIIPEYANEMNDLFLASVRNYQNKLASYFPEQANLNLKNDFLTLHIPSSSNNIIDCNVKYGSIIGKQYKRFIDFTKHSFLENAVNGIVPQELAISYEIRFKKVTDADEANLTIAHKKINPDAAYIKVVEQTDPSKSHPLSTKQVLDLIKKQLAINSITFLPYTIKKNTTFTSDAFNLIVRHFKIKEDKAYCYCHVSQERSFGYTYSHSVIQFIIDKINSDPSIFLKIKQKKD